MSKNYSGKLDIDVSGFNKALKEAKANLALVASEFKLAKEQGSAFETSSEKLQRTIDSLKKVFDESKNKTEILRQKYEAMANVLGETDTKVVNAKKAWIDSKTATEKLSNEIANYTKELENNNKESETFVGCTENMCHALTAFEQVTIDVVEAIGKKLVTAIVDFTKETVNTGLQFETAFAGVKKVVDGTSEDFAKLQDEIRKTATEKPISADALASLYQAGAQLGIDKDNLKDFTNAIIDLQNTSDLTAEAGATMLAQYANVMHLPAEEYERFASTLSYLGSTTATTESRIMAMAQRMSGAGSSIGMTHQGLLALATAMGSVGIEAEMGGSAISTIMLNIETAVAKSNDKLLVWAETAGMTAEEFTKLWKTDVTGAIQAVLKGLSDEKAGGESLILTLEELGIKNIRQRQTMLQLSSASDMLTETINKANQEWENNTFLAESSSRVYETTANQIELMKNSFKEVQLSIYDNLSVPLQEVTKELTEFLKSSDVKKFSKDLGTALVDLGKFVATLARGIISNFDKICVAVKAIIPILAGVTTRFLALKTINFVSGIITNIKNLTTAFFGLNAAMMANPAGLIATAFGLLATTLLGYNAIMGDTTTAYGKQTKAVLDETKAIAEEKQALLETKEAREANISKIETEYNGYQDLIDELKTIVDENGNVKAGYEDRINEIIPLLQNATGEEIRLINNQIQGYDALIIKLDQVIAKKRAEARISAYEGDYKEAIKGLDDSAKKRKEANKEYNDILHQMIEMEKNGTAYESIAYQGSGGDRSKQETTEYRLLKKQKEALTNRLHDITDMTKEYYNTRDEYEKMLADYYKEYEVPKTPTVTPTPPSTGSNGTTVKSDGTKSKSKSSAKKEKEKTEEDLLKEGNYTYETLKELDKKYKNDLKFYAEEMKKGNSNITVAMVEDTKKNLDTVEKKMKEIKEVLGEDINIFSTEKDNTKEELEKKKDILEDTLSKLAVEMKEGNTAITQDMLDQIDKAIDQTDAKLQKLKDKYDSINEDEENEISEEVYANNENTEAHATGGVIYGKGVLSEDAIYDNAAKQAQLEADIARQAELAIQEENLLANANEDALNKQIATLDPSNVDIYNTTQRLLAESEQTAHAQGLDDNAYKVVDSELKTLNQAKQAALTIDFTSVGLYICQGIANGINANKDLVISAVRSMMEEANSACEDTEEIGSPSKVFYRYGKYIDQGLANGIRDYASEASKQIKGISMNLQDSLSGINALQNIKSSNNQAIIPGNGKTEINYNFTQNNTSMKSLDNLALYKESKSLLKRTIRNQYV